MYPAISIDLFPTEPIPSLENLLRRTAEKLGVLLGTPQEIKAAYHRKDKYLDPHVFDWQADFEPYVGSLLNISGNQPQNGFSLHHFILSQEYPIAMASSGTLAYMLADLQAADTKANIPDFAMKYEAIKHFDTVFVIETGHHQTPLGILGALVCANELGRLSNGVLGPESFVGSKMEFPCDFGSFWPALIHDPEFVNLVAIIEKETSTNNLLDRCRLY